jgi:hypothetical protein
MRHMNRQTFFLTTLLLTSCGQSVRTDDKAAETANDTSTESRSITTVKADDNADTKFDNALTFINGYVDNCSKMNERINIVDWVNSNELTTSGFKTELKRILDDAYKDEPEVGLDFDPILNAQDYPDKGFEIETFDEVTNYLTVKGKNWPEFKMTMKIIEDNGNWLVDGCGIINIPADKRTSE